MDAGKLFAIGLGPGPRDLVPPRAVEILEHCDVVYSFLTPGSPPALLLENIAGADKVEVREPASRHWGNWADDPFLGPVADEIATLIATGKSVAWACAGDVGIYSPFAYLERQLLARRVPFEIVPGISFLNALAMASGETLVDEEGRIIMAHIEEAGELNSLFSVATTVVLYSVDKQLLRGIRDYVLMHDIREAHIVRVGEDQASSTRISLREEAALEYAGGGACVIKRRKIRLPEIDSVSESRPADRGKVRVVSGSYRRVGDDDIEYTAFLPAHPGPRPALLLFHGGSWGWGHRDQFYPQCHFLSQLGVACVTFDYRVLDHHGTSPFEAVDDATFALQWVIENAANLSIDIGKISIGGGSAGGHIAIWAAMNVSEKLGKRPNEAVDSLVLYNPVTDTSENGFGADRIPGDPSKLDVNLNLPTDMPPAIVFHGLADKTVPFKNSCDFRDLMEAKGADCSLFLFEGRPHAFFNKKQDRFNGDYYDVLQKTVEFFVSRGYVDASAVGALASVRDHDMLQHVVNGQGTGGGIDPSFLDRIVKVHNGVVKLGRSQIETDAKLAEIITLLRRT